MEKESKEKMDKNEKKELKLKEKQEKKESKLKAKKEKKENKNKQDKKSGKAQNKKANKKVDKFTIFSKVLAAFLAIFTILGTCFTCIYLIVNG